MKVKTIAHITVRQAEKLAELKAAESHFGYVREVTATKEAPALLVVGTSTSWMKYVIAPDGTMTRDDTRNMELGAEPHEYTAYRVEPKRRYAVPHPKRGGENRLARVVAADPLGCTFRFQDGTEVYVRSRFLSPDGSGLKTRLELVEYDPEEDPDFVP